ncbi:MAG: YgaP-like transmembrane domain [Flavitalea sp.]
MNDTISHSGLAGAAANKEHDMHFENISQLERAISIGIGALLIYSGFKRLRKSPVKSLSRAAVGYGLMYRGVSGLCPVYRNMGVDGAKTTAVNIRTHLTVNKPKDEVYAVWRKLENLPLFMSHLSSVKETGGSRSHWEAKFPDNNPIAIKWEAEIVKDEPGVILSWHSLPGTTIENAGKVEFREALGGRGTDLRIIISYRPPAGNIGHGISWLFNPLFSKMVEKDLLNFKQFVEMKGTSSAGQFAS